MELWQEILENNYEETISLKSADIAALIESKCYKTLKEIKEIIENTELNDKECFMKIEEVVNAFEKIGSSGGFRHDF